MRNQKILVIGKNNYLDESRSEARTIKSFMEAFPQDNVYQVVCKDFNAEGEGQISPHLFQFSHSDIFIASSLISGKREISNNSGISISLGRKHFNIKKSLKRFVVDVYELLPYVINENFDSYIEKVHPDIVYAYITSFREIRLLNYLQKKLKVPVVPHFFDDWPNAYFTEGLSKFFLRPFFLRVLKKLIKQSPSYFCISEYMCEEYRRRYGNNNAFPLMNSENTYNEQTNETITQFKFFYAGSLYLGRGETIFRLCEALETIFSGDISFSICAPETHWVSVRQEFSKFGFVKYEGFLNQTELQKKMNYSNCLIFVESFNSEMLKFSRFSLSTRVPEYLSSGKIILALGNAEQGSIKHLRENKAAFVVDDLNNINEVLKNLLNEQYREEILQNARNLFFSKHYRPTQQERFKNVMTQCCNSR